MTPSSDRSCPILDVNSRTPHDEAARLRTAGPAVLVRLPAGMTAWSVTRHSVIRALTSDPRVSRDPRRHWAALAEVPDGWPLAAIALQENFVNLYGEEHRRERRRVAPGFSVRRVAELEPQIQATADQLVQGLAELPAGTAVDIRARLALPLTMTVICDLFGVPTPMRAPLGRVIDQTLDSTLPPERNIAVLEELHRTLAELVDHKLRFPGPDLTSDLIAPSDSEQPGLAPDELHAVFFLMIGAGFETSVNLITNAVHELLTHPGHLDLLQRGDITLDAVVEETLRHEGPVTYVPLRYAVEDIDLGEGVLIRKGEAIITNFAAAGRDPEAHPDAPDTFDPLRPDKDHLAFGYGPHFCLGAPLARLETRIALGTLLARFPRLALAEPERSPERITSVIVNGYVELPVVLEPLESTEAAAPA
ncbi:cytochrome P450 family protein [Streptacidiphilus albus]|uniref:cytochrome P450 family protein n=1 Tax=Streptacidiphilus albus TaxID=105425 RepID=UPI00054C7C4F|nr:cytochrome P450 [Streptacidiphilus albus]